MTFLGLMQLLRRHIRLVLGLPVLCLLLAVAYVVVAKGPASQDENQPVTATIYVQPRGAVDADGNIVSSTTTNDKLIAQSVAAYLTSDDVFEDVARAVGVDNLDALKIEVKPDATTSRLVNITVTSESEEDAVEVANKLADAGQDAAGVVVDAEDVRIINRASVPGESIESPGKAKPSLKSSLLKYGAVAIVGGILVSITLVVLMDALDVRVRDAAEVEELTNLPVIACIPAGAGKER